MRLIIEEDFGGKRTRLAEALGIEPTSISRYFKDGEGRRNIGTKTARRIEAVTGRPDGWMDEPHNQVREERAMYSGSSATINWDKFAPILKAVEEALHSSGYAMSTPELLEIAEFFYKLDADTSPNHSAVILLYEKFKRAG